MITQTFASANEALSNLKSGSSVFIQSAAAAPDTLIKAMVEKGEQLENIISVLT